MSHTRILKVVSVEKIKEVWITTAVDYEGNVVTGVGKDFQPGDRIITWFHDRYNRCKFSRDNPS